MPLAAMRSPRGPFDVVSGSEHQVGGVRLGSTLPSAVMGKLPTLPSADGWVAPLRSRSAVDGCVAPLPFCGDG